MLVVFAHAAMFAALWPQPHLAPVEVAPQPIIISLVSARQSAVPEPERPLSPAPRQAEVKPLPVHAQARPKPKPVSPKTPIPPVEPVAVAAPETAPPSVAQPGNPPPVAEAYQPARFDAAYLHNPAPVYPALSRRLGEQGRVLLRVRVTVDGEAGSVELEKGSGSSSLDQAALEAVKKWRFIPARRGEQPVGAWVLVPVRFSLEG
jgi:protein TonB